MGAWKLTVRIGPSVERARFDSLPEALSALERRIEELRPSSRREDLHFFRRSFDASRQVAVRGELAGPGRLRAGIDLRGDGSAEAYTGRLRRSLVEQRGGESAATALARALASDATR